MNGKVGLWLAAGLWGCLAIGCTSVPRQTAGVYLYDRYLDAQPARGAGDMLGRDIFSADPTQAAYFLHAPVPYASQLRMIDPRYMNADVPEAYTLDEP